jgi:hypothetical protein
MILFLIVGIVAFVIGFLSVFSSRFDQYVHRLFPYSQLDKRFLSEGNRYIIRRYVSGVGGMFAGIVGVAAYIESNEQLRNFVVSLFNAIFTK